MADIPIQLSAYDGQYIGRMKEGATALISYAEQTARDRNLSKRNALSIVLRNHLSHAGFEIDETELAGAAESLDLARRGQKLARLELKVRPSKGTSEFNDSAKQTNGKYVPGKSEPMTTRSETNEVISFFEVERKYPDERARASASSISRSRGSPFSDLARASACTKACAIKSLISPTSPVPRICVLIFNR